MNFILSTLTATLTMICSLIFTDNFAHLTVIYFATFFLSYCWFLEAFFKAIKKTASKGNC